MEQQGIIGSDGKSVGQQTTFLIGVADTYIEDSGDHVAWGDGDKLAVADMSDIQGLVIAKIDLGRLYEDTALDGNNDR